MAIKTDLTKSLLTLKEQIENLLYDFTKQTDKIVRSVSVNVTDVRAENKDHLVSYLTSIELKSDS